MSVTFTWNGQTLDYFDHPYNHTALNMRRVEIPIARWFLAREPQGVRLLEVGNVLAHYGPISWPVVDLREPGCLNVDVMQWFPDALVDRLLCVSTLEHIGFGKFASGPIPTYHPVDVWQRLRSFLGPGGQVLATVPLDYNAALDEALVAGAFPDTQVWTMHHTGDNCWAECSLTEALEAGRWACAKRWPGGLAVLYAEAQS